MIKIDKIDYRGWGEKLGGSARGEGGGGGGGAGARRARGRGDVGPGVMRYGFAGGQNFFKEFARQMGKTGEATWQPRGGHRVWIAPEDVVKSYAPDNAQLGRASW